MTYKRLAVVALFTVMLSAVMAGMPKSVQAAAGSNTLYPGESLGSGAELISSDGNYIAVMQQDGNLVVRDVRNNNNPIWASGSSGTPNTNAVLVNQSDDNMVIIAPGNHAIWSTRTSGTAQTVFVMQTDGNLVAYAQGGNPVWASKSDSVIDEINRAFGPYASQAVNVARCESNFNPNAYNPTLVHGSHAEGVFQILYPSTWNTTSQANQSPYYAYANIQAAHDIFTRDGNSWREWACKP